MLIKKLGDPIALIVNTTYLSILKNKNDPLFFHNKTSLAPMNDIVDTSIEDSLYL